MKVVAVAHVFFSLDLIPSEFVVIIIPTAVVAGAGAVVGMCVIMCKRQFIRLDYLRLAVGQTHNFRSTRKQANLIFIFRFLWPTLVVRREIFIYEKA